MFILAKMNQFVNVSHINPNTVLRTESLIHGIFLNYIITISNTEWLWRACTTSFLVCVYKILRIFGYFPISFLINCGYAQSEKNEMPGYNQNFRKKINEKGVLSNSICPSRSILHSIPSYATLQDTDMLKYIIRSPVLFQLGRPREFWRKRWEHGQGFDPDSLPLKSLQPGCPPWKDGTTVLHSKWPILHNSFWFWKPLLRHITIIPRESNICFC